MSALLTDLYELTMLESYLAEGLSGPSVFEMFVRRLPEDRSFLLFAGLEQALAFLDGVAFSAEELSWLEKSERFSRRTLDYLSDFRFTGDVDAMPEGTAFFAGEPVMTVAAPLPMAQLLETRLMNLLHLQTLVASKAARCVLAAPDKDLVEFGLRRARGAEAGLLGARAAYLAGFSGTSNVLAEARFGVPSSGTMAHSFVQAHEDEAKAFELFLRSHPAGVLLIDTYDTLAGARKACAVFKETGLKPRGVRLDSGDLAALSRGVREILDAGGLGETKIFASGSLDETSIAALERAGAPIDGYGVGTRLAVSGDAPSLDFVYKLVEYDGRQVRKTAPGKETLGGRKQVFRRRGEEGEPLLKPVIRDGQRVAPLPTLAQARRRARAQLEALPEGLRRLDATAGCPVTNRARPSARPRSGPRS